MKARGKVICNVGRRVKTAWDKGWKQHGKDGNDRGKVETTGERGNDRGKGE